jgi:hypothetical protein
MPFRGSSASSPRALVALIGAALALLPAATAFGQATGLLEGTVFDQSGTPIRGVKISASSPDQIGGTRVTYTNDEGRFRIPALTPGSFQVTASAPGLKSVVQDNVRITQGRVVDIDLVLEVETGPVEIIKVEEDAPQINTTQATVGVTYDAEFLDQLPLPSRDFQGAVALTAGVTDRAGTGNPQIRGGTYFNNSYNVDGFSTTDPVTHTFGQNFSFNAINQLDVQTAAFGAENSSTTGGVINIVTKSGSNRYEVDGTLTYTDQNMSFFKDNRDRGSNRAAVVSANAGGPILKDRLWFYVSAEGTNSTRTLPTSTIPNVPDHPPASLVGFNGFGKITWQASPRNKLELKGAYSVGDFWNFLQSPLIEAEAEARQFQETGFLGLSWNSVISDNLVGQIRAGFQQIKLDVEPQSCLWDPNCANVPGEFDQLSGISRRNFTSQSREYRRTAELSGDVTWFKDTRRLGSHGVRFGGRFFGSTNPAARTVPGDVVFGFSGNEPAFRREVCVNDPRLDGGVCRTGWLRSDVSGTNITLFVSDQWKPTRYLTITPGLALNRGVSQDDRQVTVTDITAVTPHLQVAWNATHDGKTVLRASYNQNVDTGFLALARFTGRRLTSRTCSWDENVGGYVGNCRTTGGDSSTTVGLPCGPDGLNPDGTTCATKLRAPRTFEYTVGASRELITGLVLQSDVVFRDFVHQFEDIETNAVWNKGGTAVQEGGWKNGRSQFVFDLETPDEARRRYLSWTTMLIKRQGLLKMLASYSWTRSLGTENTNYVTLHLDNPGQNPYFYGPLQDDFRHTVGVQAIYAFTRWLSAGVTYQFLSGGPYNRFGFDQEFRSFSRFQTRRGYDSRGTLNPDDDVQLRLPDISVLNLQVRVNLRPLIGQQVEVFGDLFNMLALRTTTDVIEADVDGFFGVGIARLPPMSLRFGLRYRF